MNGKSQKQIDYAIAKRSFWLEKIDDQIESEKRKLALGTKPGSNPKFAEKFAEMRANGAACLPVLIEVRELIENCNEARTILDLIATDPVDLAAAVMYVTGRDGSIFQSYGMKEKVAMGHHVEEINALLGR